MQKNFACDANQKWACSACTYLNWPKTIRCVQCETPRENVDNVINCLQPPGAIGTSADFGGSSSSSARSRNRSVSGSSSNDEIYGVSRDFENQFASVYISDLYHNKGSGVDAAEKSAIGNKQYSTSASSSPISSSSLYITEPSASSLSRIDSITTSTMMIDEEEAEGIELDESGNITALNKTLNTTNLLKNEKSKGAPLISDYDKPLLKKQNNNVIANEAAGTLVLNNDVSPAATLPVTSELKYKKIPQNFNNLIGKESSNKIRGQQEPQSLAFGGRTELPSSLATNSLPKMSNTNKHLPQSEAARSSLLFNEGLNLGSESSTSSKISSSNTATNCNTDKWTCGVCTYQNWPRSLKCVMCLTPRVTSDPVDAFNARPWTPKSERSVGINQNGEPIGSDGVSQVQIGNNLGTGNNRISAAGGSPLLSNNRRTLEIDTRWLEACHGVVDGNIVPVERYLTAGGDPARQLTQLEVALLNRPSAFDIGFTLIHLALRFHQEHVLAILLSQVDNQPTVVKRVPSYAAPDLAMDIRRLAMSSLRQRKGSFHCYYTSEVVTFILPSEILDLRPDVQETLFNEILDRDVQKELETGQIINWSVELMGPLNSRLYALWNRSAGDCLLDSVLQATWGIFDRDNGLRRALADSLHECAAIFYQRWKENELLHAHLLDFSLNDSQCATDWAKLLSLASKPGSSLEQLHIFTLAHILRRPIIVYGVKYVKSFRGETLGYARYEGVYLPFLWDSTFCWKWPIALGYTRGHFSALVGLEPDCVPVPGASAPQLDDKHINRAIFLPLNSLDGNILPIHFLTKSEMGKEEMILSQWLDVRFIDSGVMVACQRIQKQPPLVGQMVDEWLNHYRRLGEITSAPYLHPPTTTCYSSDDSDD